ncbi:TonB-dependent receptor [Chitinophaga varians]|uniref:TonB-dependent receptor n=1 Tax=Chitinophaga varians TaxID=2202339 RepID=UPI00165EE070|nr:TonB-dependent receptor [Chitinophaga varians]MBC9909379.1 carboxypeptidase-like regulatory domain-containing protein [Chitinophaga varians]
MKIKCTKFWDQSQKRRCHVLLLATLLLGMMAYPAGSNAQSYSLTEKVSLSLTATNATAVLEALDKQTNFSFTWSKAALRQLSLRAVSWQHITLHQALEELKEKYHIDYLVVGGTISFTVTTPPAPSTKTSAPQATGATLKGRIVDFETAQPLPGASVQLENTPKGTATDAKGYYELKDVPPGKYALLVSYIGYQRNRQAGIDIVAGRPNTYDVKMLAGKSLEGVTVTAGPHRVKAVTYSTDKEIISEIRGANAVVSGISNEQISKMADRNAAEIVKRIPGITVTDERFIVVRGMNARYNQTYLNGNLAPGTELYTHAFALDLLPAPVIDRILVYKSPTPDLFGDAAGGSVKIYTKNAKPVRHFDVGVQSGFRTTTTFKEGVTYKGSSMDWLGFDNGMRSKAMKTLPAFAESYGKTPVSQQQMMQAFSPDLQIGRQNMRPDFQAFINYFDNARISSTARLYNFTMLNYTSERRIQEVYRQTGNLYSMSFGDYELTTGQNRMATASQSMEKGRVNIMENLLLKLNSRHTVELKNFFLNEGSKNTSVTNAQLNQLPQQDSTQKLRNRDLLESFEQRTLYSGNLTGTHLLGPVQKQQVQWNIGYNYYKQQVPDQRNIRFFGKLGEGDPLAALGSNGTGYRDVYLGMINRIFICNHEENYQASLDYTYTLHPAVTLKTGAYGLFKNRHVDRRFYRVNRAGLEGVELGGYDNLGPGIWDNYGWSDPSLIRFREADLGKVWTDAYFRADGKGLALYDATQPTDSYIADERYTAFYGMGDVHLLNRQLNIVGGLRMENDRQQLSAAVVQNGAFVPLMVKKPLTVWLPSVNATYTFADSALVIRGGYGKTVNRPEFREISPFQDYDFMNDVMLTGNPKLVTARIDNYDLRFEWYPRNHPGEMINAGVFYKHLKNPIEQVRNDQSGDVNFMPTNISYWNADKADVVGIEAEVRKSLAFIPGKFFRNVSFMLNGALIKSQATKMPIGDSAQYSFYSGFKNRQLQGQAPYVLNTGFFYENSGWGLKASLTYNVAGTTIYAVSTVSTQEAHGNGKGIGGSPSSQAFIRPNLIELPRHQLDFSLTQRLLKSLNVRLNIQNLLDQATRLAEDHDYDSKYTAEKNTGIAKGSGGAFEGPLYKGDNIFRRYNTGRYFLLSFTYSF